MQQNLGVVGDIYAHNVTAMLIAQYAGIPTINGIASFNPQGVDFSRPNSPDYDQRVYLYAKRHQIFNLCRLDLNAKHWSIIKSSDIDHAYVRVPFFDESTWRGRIYDVQGLSGFEEWGAWSVSNTVVFEFNTPLPERFDLHLNARAFGPNIGKDFKVDAGGGVAVFRFTDSSDQKKILTIHNQAGSKILKINIPNPISPKLLSNGQSSDDRNLGIGFVEMKIVASE